MPETQLSGYISQIQLPSGNIYGVKDTVARSLIGSAGEFVIAWNGNSTPTIANIPEGVVVTYSNTQYTGTKVANASTLKKFYLVKSPTDPENPDDVYDEYVTVITGGTDDNPTYSWEKIGDTQIRLTEIVTGVTFTKQTTSAITSDATLQVTQQPTYTVTTKTTYVQASATGASGSVSTAKLKTADVYTVSSTQTTASKISTTTKTTLTNSTTSDTTVDAWLKGWSVDTENEILTINGVQPQTQEITAIEDITSVYVPIKLTNTTTIATGSTTSSGDGATVAISGTVSVTNPTISLSTTSVSATGMAKVGASGSATVSQSKTATIGWDNKTTATVLTDATTVTAVKS